MHCSLKRTSKPRNPVRSVNQSGLQRLGGTTRVKLQCSCVRRSRQAETQISARRARSPSRVACTRTRRNVSEEDGKSREVDGLVDKKRFRKANQKVARDQGRDRKGSRPPFVPRLVWWKEEGWGIGVPWSRKVPDMGAHLRACGMDEPARRGWLGARFGPTNRR
jgi:hypothetical protein